MKWIKRLLVIVTIIIILISALLLFMFFSENGKILLPVEKTNKYMVVQTKASPSRLSVEGNQLMMDNHEPIIIKGISTVSPDKLHNRNLFNESLFTTLKDLGANAVRLPIDPVAWESDDAYMWRYIDKAVEWSDKLGMYLIIDLHMIGNIDMPNGDQMPEISVSPKDFALTFWDTISKHYIDAPNVLFEIYNEPANIEAEVWSNHAMDLIDTIRGNHADQIIIVSGIDYTKNLSWYLNHPIVGENIAYSCHIYPDHKSLFWDDWFGKLSQVHPIIMTEWGYVEDPSATDQPYLVGTSKYYGQPLMTYLADHQISWIAWSYDDRCEPEMLLKYHDNLTDFGEFVKQALSN